MNRRESLYFQLARLLILAAVCSGIAFSGMRGIGIYFLNHYFETSDYIEQKNHDRMKELQDSVTQNNISTRDSEFLTRWVYRQRGIFMQVYCNSVLVYDSNYAEETEGWDAPVEIGYYDWEAYYKIRFSDSEAEVMLYGFYERKFYGYALIAEILVSILLFLMIVMLGIRNKMKYITQLSREIGILEGGDLKYQVTVKGKDELAVLARGIDDMRKSFAYQVEQEAHLTKANRRMITEMSHDLRTPLTSMMIYMEILKNHRYHDEAQMEEYIDRIDRKMHQLKQLSEHIFEYSLVSSEVKVDLEEPESFQTLFYDLLSEVSAYLEQNGFTVEMKLHWGNGLIRINAGYLTRVMDNVLSNLLKYAKQSEPVTITAFEKEEEACICFENQIRQLERKEDSTNIGLVNTKRMMEKMHGTCRTENTTKIFRTKLCFFKVGRGAERC